ncbi:hypothetical protein ACFXP7_04835 [Microbacterium sp. P06]|uniref:hypothetical protein n=1 Tax=Microbacterium sp. P06 TaxID=3366949 RepID=UPI003746BC15
MAHIDPRDLENADLDAVRLLIAREAERPLYARVSATNEASLALLTKLGFAEVSRGPASAPGLGQADEEIVFALPPTLE